MSQLDNIRGLLLIVAALFPFSVYSQTYSFKHYSSADGLELSSLNTIFQDSKGSLWFGGVGGGFRYDGIRFIPYLTKGAERSVVTRITESTDGTIWMATEGNGIAKIRYGEIESISWMRSTGRLLPSDSVYIVYHDTTGATWIGTRNGVLVLYSNGTSVHLTRNSGLYGNWVRAIGKDHHGGIWVATTGGVTRFIIGRDKKNFHEKIFQGPVISLTVLKNGTVIFGTIEGKEEEGRGIFAFENGTLRKVVRFNDFSGPIKPQTLYQESNGALWVGTTRGCIRIHNGTVTRINKAQGLLNETIGSIVEDTEGSMWFGTGNGVMKLPRRYSLNYSEIQGISGMLTMMVDEDNTVWCGGYSPLYKIGMDDKVQFMNNEPLLKECVIYSLAQDRRENIWIGTQFGLIMYDGKKFSRQNIGSNPSTTLVSSLAADAHGGIWVGLKGEILNIRDGKIIRKYRNDERIPDADISTLMVDRIGRIWFGTNGGSGMIDRNDIITFGKSDGLPSNDVERIKEDSKGRVWFVTQGGIVYWNEGRFHSLTKVQFPYDDSRVATVHEDRTGHLWFGTWFGLIEWSDSVLARYDTRDGLSGDIIQGIGEDSKGNLWIGTSGGLTKFPHRERMMMIPVPTVAIERISDEVERRIVTARTEIPYDERTVTFQAASLSFFDERNMEFQYRLDEIEKDWNPVTKQRIFRYTTLPTGEYTMFVRARNRNGAWTSPAKYSFEILPPFWKSWWFIILISATAITVVLLVIRQRIHRLQKEAASQELFSKQLMQVYESERKRIASELHDGLGQNLLIIANRAKMGLKKTEILLMQKELEIISASALESIGDVRTITYNLHPLQVDEVGITTALESMLKRVATVTDGKLTFTVEQIDDLLPKEDQIHFYRIIQETLNNAIKHSGAEHIEVIVVKDGDSIRASIKDDGKGFDPTGKKEGYGIRSLNERVKILNGHSTIDSSPGSGTIVKILIETDNKRKEAP